jgi:DNA primase
MTIRRRTAMRSEGWLNQDALVEFFEQNLDIAVRNGDEARVSECLFCGTPRTMKVNIRTGDFICFHKDCQKRGRRAQLVMALLDCDFDTAIGRIASILSGKHRAVMTNEEMVEQIRRPERTRTPRRSYGGLPDEYIPCFDGENFQGGEFLTYLLETRNLSLETIQQWDIGYAEEGRLAGRVIIPVRTNEVTTWVARAALPGVSPKYRTERDGPTKILFGYNELEEGMDVVAAVEGTFDAMRLWSYGTPATGYLKDGLSVSQVSLLERKKPKRLVMFPDGGDRNAQVRAIRTALAIESRFNEVAVVLVEGNQKVDPDAGDRELIEKLIREARPVTRLDMLKYRMSRVS